MDRVPYGQQHPDAQGRDNSPYGFIHDQDENLESLFPQPSTANTYNAWGSQVSAASGGTAGNGSGDLAHGSNNAWQQTVHSTNPLHSQSVSHFDHPFSGPYGGGYGSHNMQGNPYGFQHGAHNFDSFNLGLNSDASYGGLAGIGAGPYGQMPVYPDGPGPSQTISPSALHNPLSPYGQLSLSNADDDDPNEDPSNSFSADLDMFQTPSIYHAADSNTLAQIPHSSSVKLPQGVRQGNFWIPDLKKLAMVTNSKRLKGYLFVSDDTVPSVEKGKLTDILKKRSGIDKDGRSMRPSRNDCIARVKSQQGTRPFTNVQKGYFKTLSSQTSASIRSNERPSLASQSPPEAESSQESEESSDPSDSEVEEDVEHPPLPSVRPTNPAEAAEYDVIKVVWAPSYSSPSAEAIRTALRDHWKILQPIVGAWRKAKDGLKDPATQKGNVDRLQSQADRYRKILERILGATVKHGHQDIVGLFGENKQLFVLFYQLLVDRYVVSDCDNQLVQDIFSLMVKYNTIDSATWESAKLDKVVPKIEKKAKTDQVKSLAKQVLQLVVNFKGKESARKVEDSIASKVEGTSGVNSSVRQKGESITARKAVSRDAITPTTGVTKKPETKLKRPGEVSSAKPSSIASKSAAIGKPNTVKPTSVANVNAANNSTTANPAVKIKANPVAAKPTSFFSSLQSASKKPGTSNAAKSSQQVSGKPSDHKDGVTASPSEVKAAPKFSFAETLANIAKPKETPSSDQPSKPELIETPEEKAKRIRKEERRKLRVHFKPDDELVEIRMLTHDPEEDLGHDDTLTRDAGDLRGEARSFKMHRDQNERLDDDDEGMTAGAAAAANENTSLNAQSGHFHDDRSSDLRYEAGSSSQSSQAHSDSALDSVMKMFKDPNSSIRDLLASRNPTSQPYQVHAPQPNQSQSYQPTSYPSSQPQRAPTPPARPPRTGYDLYYHPREEWWKLAGTVGKIDSREKLEQLFRLYPQKPPEQPPAPPPPASMQSQQFQPPNTQTSNLPPNMQALLAALGNVSASQAPPTGAFPNPNGFQNVNQQQLASVISGLNMAQLQSLFGAAAAPQPPQPPNPNPFAQFQAPFPQASAPQAQGIDVQALLNQLALNQTTNPQQPAGFPPLNFGFQGAQPGTNMQQPASNYGFNYQSTQPSQGPNNNQTPNYDNQQGGRHYKRKRDGDDVNDFHEGKSNRGDRKKVWRNNSHR